MFDYTPPKNFDFKTFSRPDSPNNYLVCPKEYCNANVDRESPKFSLPARSVYEKWAKLMAKQPRVELVYINNDDNQYTYVQRSKWLRFPDTIHVKFIPIDDNHSKIAIYSHANYGYYDFGVNKSRVTNWLNQLLKQAPVVNNN